MRAIAGWAAVAAVALTFGAVGWGEETRPSVPKPTDPPKKETVYWIVIEVKDLNQSVTWEAIRYKDLKDRVDRAKEAYVSALEAWNQAKADAAKTKMKFDKPKPVQGYVKRIGETTVYKVQQDAQDAARKLVEEAAARQKAAQEREKALSTGKAVE
jgi:hypothetical protein